MKTTTLAALTVGVLAPSLALAIRDLCGKTETWHNEFYTVNNNLWGVEDPSNPPGGGSQCSWVDSQGAVGSELLTWHTSWTWPGGTVKSYAYAGVNFKPLKVGDIKALSNNAEWSYRNWPSAGNVAYDLFTSHNETHVTSSGDYEIMVWLWRAKQYPIGSKTKTVTIEGHTWDLYDGTNNGMHTYTFLNNGEAITQFGGDLNAFFKWLAQNEEFPLDKQYLLTYQLGVEAIKGEDATFMSHHWKAGVET